MAKVKYTNNADTTLSSGIGTGDSSLVVVSATNFPSLSGGDWFYATLSEGSTIEIVKVTATSGTTFTITRAQDGTSASAFTTAAHVSLRVVRALLDELVASKATILETARNIAIGTDASGSASFDGSGDITINITIANNAVSLAKMADMATASFLGRNTASTGDPEVLSIATAKTMLSLAGTNSGDQTITLTGDVTGSGTGSFAATVVNLPAGVTMAGRLVATAIAAPSTPAAGLGALYLDSTSKNLCVKDDAGVIKHGVKTKAAVSNSFVTAIDDDGTVTVVQPAFSNISGSVAGSQMPALSGDISTSAGDTVTTIGANKVTLSMMAQVATARLLGRTTAGTGDVEALSVLPTALVPAFSGGDVTSAGGSLTLTLGDDTVTLAKMANIATDRLLGRDTAATGDPEALTVGGGIEFTGSGGIQTSAFTGDVTKPAGGTATTIANDAVTYAKMQNISATQRVLGRNTSGAGDTEEVTLSQLLDWVGSAANGDMLARASGSWTRVAAGTSGQILKSAGAAAPTWVDNVVTLTFIIDGGGATITTGVKGFLEIPFGMTITGWTILADASGSIVVDVWKDTYANFPPVDADSIAGSELPTLSSAQKNQDLSLSTWTTSVTAGDILAFNVDSATTVQRVTISIRGTKT